MYLISELLFRTGDRGHMTCDALHMAHDTCLLVNILKKYQGFKKWKMISAPLSTAAAKKNWWYYSHRSRDSASPLCGIFKFTQNIKYTLLREGFKKKANYPHFVDKLFNPPPPPYPHAHALTPPPLPLSTFININNIFLKIYCLIF